MFDRVILLRIKSSFFVQKIDYSLHLIVYLHHYAWNLYHLYNSFVEFVSIQFSILEKVTSGHITGHTKNRKNKHIRKG